MTHPTPRPFLMGSETEYAVSGHHNGQIIYPDGIYDRLTQAIRLMRATVADHHGCHGLYLENGGRFYLDYGSHPEYATAECHTPRQVAMYDKAGEHLMRLAIEHHMGQNPNLTIRVLKNNLDAMDPDETTYGNHESYTSWVSSDVVGPQIIPHLASRVLYCGSGALTGHSRGTGFELSQRARHMHETEGDDTTCSRAIFSTRIRKTMDGGSTWTRIHLISKDSQRAPFGIYLTYAVTGLLIEMINRGERVGTGLKLSDPVGAMRNFSLDPWGKVKVRLADGRQMSAAEIQAQYLEQCEKALQRGILPDWAGEAIGHWRETLAAIERDPMQLADRLDPYCKLLLFTHELKRANREWADVQKSLERLATMRSFGDDIGAAVLADSDANLSPEYRAIFPEARQRVQAGEPGVLDGMRFANRLRALDLKYHELGGLYDRLHDTGRLRDVILTPLDIEEASRTPPPGGRANLRGMWIRHHREEDWRADWHFVWRASDGTCIDLRDPFSGVERTTRVQLPANRQPWEIDIVHLLARPTSAA